MARMQDAESGHWEEEAARYRVTDPEPDIPEDIHGAVITALNEEAVACAALANTGGINLIHTYEAFGCTWVHILQRAARMFGLARENLLTAEELAVLDGKGSPEGVVI